MQPTIQLGKATSTEGTGIELVLAPPLSKRRDEWMESVAKRLEGVEANVNSMRNDPAFVTTALQATQIALRTY
jgi:hypothetical protein